MNHLAHAHLATGATAAVMAGSVLGDFAKGPITGDRWPAELAGGLRLHRRIDSFTDQHPLGIECRERFPRDWRRLAGPCLDVCWDHCLSRQWPRWHSTPLPDFCRAVTPQLPAFAARLSPKALAFSHWLHDDAVLESYATLDGIEAALDLMQHRLPGSRGVAAVGRRWLEQNLCWLESRFALLYAEALSVARPLLT